METNTATATISKNIIDSAILALTGLIESGKGHIISKEATLARIQLEKDGVIRPLADRVKDRIPLPEFTEQSYLAFKAIATGDSELAEGAKKVVELTEQMLESDRQLLKRDKAAFIYFETYEACV
ncbi:MAG: hypothetical protein QM627_05220 [Luteolibacter sp.]